jgi:hypothetical protein
MDSLSSYYRLEGASASCEPFVRAAEKAQGVAERVSALLESRIAVPHCIRLGGEMSRDVDHRDRDLRDRERPQKSKWDDRPVPEHREKSKPKFEPHRAQALHKSSPA